MISPGNSNQQLISMIAWPEFAKFPPTHTGKAVVATALLWDMTAETSSLVKYVGEVLVSSEACPFRVQGKNSR
jgi:hypothetical protein